MSVGQSISVRRCLLSNAIVCRHAASINFRSWSAMSPASQYARSLPRSLCQWPVCGPRFWPGESPHPCGSSSGFQGRPPGVVVSCEVEGRLRCRGRCSSTDRLRAGCPGRNVVTRNWRGCNETCAGIATPARDSPPVPELEGSTNRGTPRGQGGTRPRTDVVLDLLELATAIRIAYRHFMPASARRGPLDLCKGQAVRGFCG